MTASGSNSQAASSQEESWYHSISAPLYISNKSNLTAPPLAMGPKHQQLFITWRRPLQQHQFCNISVLENTRLMAWEHVCSRKGDQQHMRPGPVQGRMSKFHQYAFGAQVQSDHKPLEAILARLTGTAPAGLQRMLLQLQKHEFRSSSKKAKTCL